MRREIEQADYDAALAACVRAGEKPTIGAIRARLKAAGFSDRQLRIQGFDQRAIVRQIRQEAAKAAVRAGVEEVIREHEAVRAEHRGPAYREAIGILIFVVACLWAALGIAWLVR